MIYIKCRGVEFYVIVISAILFCCITENFQEQVEMELKHREEIAKQLQTVRGMKQFYLPFIL